MAHSGGLKAPVREGGPGAGGTHAGRAGQGQSRNPDHLPCSSFSRKEQVGTGGGRSGDASLGKDLLEAGQVTHRCPSCLRGLSDDPVPAVRAAPPECLGRAGPCPCTLEIV